MLEGLWTVKLGMRKTEMHGGGVVVFENQRVFGGSGYYFYTGNYAVRNDVIQGEVEVKFYGRKTLSILGALTNFRVRFSGKVRKVMELQNSIVEDSEREIFVRLSKRAELA